MKGELRSQIPTRYSEIFTEASERMNAVDGWMLEEEAKCLALWTLIACRESDADLLEFGSYRGKATVTIGSVLQRMSIPRRLYAIDPGGEEWIGGSTPSFGFLEANLSRFGLKPWVTPVQCAPDLAGLELPVSLCLALIDGDHSLAGIRRESQFAADRLVSGGFLVFHDDRHDWFPEVWLHCRQMSERYGWSLVAQAGSLSVFQKP